MLEKVKKSLFKSDTNNESDPKKTKKFFKKRSNKVDSENSNKKNENQLLSTPPPKMMGIINFTKEYNVDRKIDKSLMGTERLDSEFNNEQEFINQRFNNYNNGR